MAQENPMSIDWQAVSAALGDIPQWDDPVQLRRKSRDFYWYSPILRRQLDGCLAERVVQPQDQAELSQCLAVAYQHQIPVVLRGGGTGNYGQAVPLQGGLVIDMGGVNRIIDITDNTVRVEAGCNIRVLNEALREHGQELPVFPSTEKLATIGGFIAGGSGGIGSIEHGMLRNHGNILSLEALSVEAIPQRHSFHGADTLLIHHKWGINGVITELVLRTVPRRAWLNCVASFPDYSRAYQVGVALGLREDLHRKLVSTVSAPFTRYFSRLKEHLGGEQDLLLAMIAREHLTPFTEIVESHGGVVRLAMDDAQIAAAELPHTFEFSYNHTTLQVLKKDRGVTYLQVFNPPPLNADAIAKLQPLLGEDVWMHHEFARLDGELVSFDLPVVRYHDDEQLNQVIRCYEDNGCPVANPHTHILEDGGMPSGDYRYLAWKKRLDPLGLLNPGKSRLWPQYQALSPEAIEAL